MFNEEYSVRFKEARVLDICKNLEAANFIHSEWASTYDCYICVTLLYLDRKDVIWFVEDLRKREPLSRIKVRLAYRQFISELGS